MNLQLVYAIALLCCSNVFMTLAWYYHLSNDSLSKKPWFIAAVVSWFIALAEYMLQVPGNRLGERSGLNLGQLKVIQEVITLAVFVPVAILVLKFKPDRNFLYAACCMVGAVFFVMRSKPA
ncbi:hypothetical protein EON77_08445 [bacterium]|nr:MAG: hypothetical protein EON77_08445 [bacterium]